MTTKKNTDASPFSASEYAPMLASCKREVAETQARLGKIMEQMDAEQKAIVDAVAQGNYARAKQNKLAQIARILDIAIDDVKAAQADLRELESFQVLATAVQKGAPVARKRTRKA